MKLLKLIKLLFLVNFIFVLQLKLSAQEPWGLEKCINYSIEHNIQVKQMEIKAKSSQSNLQQSKIALTPDLNASISDAWQFGYTIDPFTNDFTNSQIQSLSTGVSSSVTLFSGLQQSNNIKKNNYTLMADLQEIEEVKYSITVMVATAYLQILFDKELLEVAKNQMQITSEQEKRTKILVDAGSLAKGNLLEIQAQLASEELNKVNAENNLKTSYLDLTQLLELDTTEAFQIEIPSLDDPSDMLVIDSISRIYQESLDLPQIKKQEYKLQSSEKSLDIAKGGLSPRIFLQASYGSGYSSARTLPDGSLYPYTDQLVDNRSLQFVVGMQIPLFSNFTNKNNITQSKLTVENSKYQLELAKRQLFKDIQQARNSAESALARFKSSKKAEEAQLESFSYTQQKFNLGLVNSVDYNTAKIQLTKVQSDKVQAKYEFLFRVNILNFYMGMPFKL
ncbi:MAG: TolC family protein [Bacteroidales bacterium]